MNPPEQRVPLSSKIAVVNVSPTKLFNKLTQMLPKTETKIIFCWLAVGGTLIRTGVFFFLETEIELGRHSQGT